MRVLVDTHAFLWWIADAKALSPKARKTIGDPANECLVSLASCWEIAIKVSLGKLQLPGVVERFIPEQLAVNDFQQLALEFKHVARVASLPFHHRDPFDRVLVAQALEEQCAVITGDRVFREYGVERVW